MIKRTLFTMPVPKKLDEIVRLPLFKTLDPLTLRNHWLNQFSLNDRVISGVLSRSEWSTVRDNSLACPMFIVPVKREDGSSFNMVSQFQDGKHCLLTYLEQYRSDPSKAPPYMALSIYDELVSSKEVALLRADIIAADITKPVGNRIVKYLREFYADPGKFEWVKAFNCRPREFDYSSLVRQYPEYF